MTRLFLSLALVCMAITAKADAPNYYDLVDLPADDPLNVRAAPDAAAEILATIPTGTRSIEVAKQDASGKWGRIIWNETTGWIAVRFLTLIQPRKFLDSNLPDGLICSGAEPFWGLSLRQPSAVFSTPKNETLILNHQLTQVAAGRQSFPVSINLAGETHQAAPIIRPAACTDGMSDRIYPWTIDMIVQSGGQLGFLTGCCHLPFDAGEN